MNQRKINKILFNIDMSQSGPSLYERIKPTWGKYMAYHIYNVPTDVDYIKMYEETAESLGEIRLCHSVNDKSTKFSKSRDIKYNPELYHYFASTTRQPLHTDYAYYETGECPDWLMLYCITPSEYGGLTHLLSTQTLNKILQKYNPKLLEKIKIDVTWSYKGDDGDKIHVKPLYDGKFINWNYWQIKEELNTSETISIKQEFFEFLEKVITDGSIYDFSKSWNPGDCVLFNDHLMLHGRDAFLGEDRWLKDHAFYNKINNV